ncbi:MAG TPA: hypothetical protein VGL74_10240 [Terriglobales bacterium]
MKHAMALVLSFALALSVVGAQAQTTTSARKKRAAAARTDSAVAQQLGELKQALDAQQQQIKQLSDQIQGRDQQIQQLEQRLDQSQSAASAAQAKADAAASQSAQEAQDVSTLKSDVTDLRSNNTNSALTLQETQKTIQELGSPVAIRYKGISITPGGFVAAETVNRQRAAASDINTPFTGIPYTANALSKIGEMNLTARQSRLSLLGESKVGDTKLTGYWEADWLGTGVTSNNRQSNSYVMRQRVIYGQAAFKSGLSVTAGQMWSLVTEDKKGIQNRQELSPLTIDPQYNVGFSWARQYGLRLVQDFGGKFALGVAIEGPQATVGGRGFSSVATSVAGVTTATGGNTILDAPGSGGGLFNFADTSGYTINKAPDVIVKAAIDPGWGHYEVFGLFSEFRNRIYPCGVVGSTLTDTVPGTTSLPCPIDGTTAPSAVGAFNDSRTGGGVGANFRIPIIAKKLEFAGQGLAGDGVGRYGSAQIPDLTFRPNGTEALIRTAHGLAGLEGHTKKLDMYAYAGGEYGARASYTGYDSITVTKTPAIPATATTVAIPATTSTKISTTGIGGYGSPFATNSGCQKELPPSNALGQFPPASAPFTPSSGGSCAGDTRLIGEGTLGFWYKFYNGPKGGFRLGIQYSYFEKYGWSGNGNVAGAAGFAPKAVDNMIWTSIRYYLP